MHLLEAKPVHGLSGDRAYGSVWLCLILWVTASATLAQPRDLPLSASTPTADQEPITPIPQAPVANPLKLALGERLFGDRRLSHDGTLACSSCHDLRTNGAERRSSERRHAMRVEAGVHHSYRVQFGVELPVGLGRQNSNTRGPSSGLAGKPGDEEQR